jgi:hypothetical protein
VRVRLLRLVVWTLAGAGLLYLLLLIPNSAPDVPSTGGTKPFAWNRDAFWGSLETQFRDARRQGCESLQAQLESELGAIRRLLVEIDAERLGPDDERWETLETGLFHLAPLVAACPGRASQQVALFTTVRAAIKRQSTRWDMGQASARDRIYRLLYGGRAAVEEVLLQRPPGAVPVIVRGEPIPSRTPSVTVRGVEIHSGDILISRGGAPSSALIARGSDFPGNFSHAAIVHVDEKTAATSIVEARIEAGLGVSSIDQYLDGTKLRVMVLRVRPDLPALLADPMIPHKAASRAIAAARAGHVPYDFEMNYQDHARQFCSEVVSANYEPLGISLWTAISTISSPGLRSWLAAFGVRYFRTQEPSDLEYDPQLSVVAEWRDPETLFQDHADSAVVDAMLERAEAGTQLGYSMWRLPFARVAKAYSALQNASGRVGPLPEGMSAETALRFQAFTAWHRSIRDAVLSSARAFEARSGYRPPYWELVRIARDQIQE